MSISKGHIDWFILLPVVGLMLFSIAFVYSASATIAELKFGSAEELFFNHTIRIILGLITVLIFAKIDYRIWRKVSKPAMFIAVALLAMVLIGGYAAKGASRWLHLGPINFQPSEFAKFAMLIHFSTMLAAKQQNIKDFQTGFVPFILWTLLLCLLIALQPNFSTTLVIYIIATSMMFIGNINLLHLGTTTLIGLAAAGIFMVSAEYRMKRLLGYFSASGDTELSVNYQLKQALIALGTGGIFGVGPGQSRQSHIFLPESYGDFIFSIIGEEYGFVGLTVIIATFIFIFWRGMLVAKKAPDDYGYFLAIGIIITFAIYVFVNAGVNVGLLPTTGLPMPFVSYGGTAVLFYAAEIGILLNISAQAGVYPRK